MATLNPRAQIALVLAQIEREYSKGMEFFLEDNLLFQLSYEALNSSTRRVLVVSSSLLIVFNNFNSLPLT